MCPRDIAEPRAPSLEHNLRTTVLELGLERNEEAGLPHSTLYHRVRITGGDIKGEKGYWYTGPAIHLESLAMMSNGLPVGLFSIRWEGVSFSDLGHLCQFL